jgi:sorbitol-specific phosphotransferase system component IIC
MTKKRESERIELLWRILVSFVTGIILEIWEVLIGVIIIFHFIFVLITGERSRDLAEFCEYYNSERYRYLRYLTFNTNKKPFPFSELKKLSKFEK